MRCVQDHNICLTSCTEILTVRPLLHPASSEDNFLSNKVPRIYIYKITNKKPTTLLGTRGWGWPPAGGRALPEPPPPPSPPPQLSAAVGHQRTAARAPLPSAHTCPAPHGASRPLRARCRCPAGARHPSPRRETAPERGGGGLAGLASPCFHTDSGGEGTGRKRSAGRARRGLHGDAL